MPSSKADEPWELTIGDGPIVAAAVHNGHAVRQDVARLLALSSNERLHEEDPFTGRWTTLAPTRVVATRSRFEVDFNRPREKAVYLCPSDAWGLEVWKAQLPQHVLSRSLDIYDRFYRVLHALLADKIRRYGHVVVLDLHSYNYRRAGPQSPPEDPAANPDVNIGTGTMNRDRWAPVVERVLENLRAYDGLGRPLDVRENVRFFGGYVPRWVHETFPETGCAVAIEVKKFFMDEWTGKLQQRQFAGVERALASVVPGLCKELQEFNRSDDSHDNHRRQVRRTDRGRRRATRAEQTRPP